ncbi:DUF6392 family protein [Escherichia coli]|uniref:DUF6392 family protein n=2 Tax=Escherichia coli TaxID=562 RepID=UPI0006655B62|nr:DUF6392 family protein [Escherichia coli]EFF6687796.1 pyocin immunity protein [Escherichia coli]EFH1075948.1 pyocin immunity protein [Escherichia coli]EFJ2340576.1 pyocin immunity protein [Escherichia coli]EHW4836663.1 pyocin immunity protein [Escherichia coli]EIN6893370.1 pyocin immunity protein [Escherichia coli]
MTVNIEALINSLGKSYKEIFDAGFIPYKTKSTGFSGDPELTLEMVREGVFLSFKRNGRFLQGVELFIQNPSIKGWTFPNELPHPLKESMSRIWIHETLGYPLRSIEPKIIMNTVFGWRDLYQSSYLNNTVSMQVSYDVDDAVKTILYLPESELHW